jgi:hypothetical protein
MCSLWLWSALSPPSANQTPARTAQTRAHAPLPQNRAAPVAVLVVFELLVHGARAPGARLDRVAESDVLCGEVQMRADACQVGPEGPSLLLLVFFAEDIGEKPDRATARERGAHEGS